MLACAHMYVSRVRTFMWTRAQFYVNMAHIYDTMCTYVRRIFTHIHANMCSVLC